MRDVTLSYRNLAPVLLLDKTLETTPDPFRLQGNKIVFTIPFVEYKNFIRYYLRSVDYLATPTNVLRMLETQGKDNILYRCYLKDVACAIGKELSYAENAHKPASHIRHCSDSPIVYDNNSIKDLYSTVTTEGSFREYLQIHEYPVPKHVSECNMILWRYANVLYHMSQTMAEEWEVSFV